MQMLTYTWLASYFKFCVGSNSHKQGWQAKCTQGSRHFPGTHTKFCAEKPLYMVHSTALFGVGSLEHLLEVDNKYIDISSQLNNVSAATETTLCLSADKGACHDTSLVHASNACHGLFVCNREGDLHAIAKCINYKHPYCCRNQVGMVDLHHSNKFRARSHICVSAAACGDASPTH